MLFARKKKRAGIALGSGGAKGFAHIGALQALLENGIAFDAAAGASAGAIVGALYAKGYSPPEILSIFRSVDWGGTALSVFLTRSSSPLEKLLDDALDGADIGELGKPFAASATNTADGSGVILREGRASRAVFASCAVPPLFPPVEIGGMRLADGGFSNAVPADAVRSLGADFVIGITLSPAETYAEREYTTESGRTLVTRQTGITCCDVLLSPDLSAYSGTSVFSAEEIYDIGYACARDRMPEIRGKMQKAGL